MRLPPLIIFISSTKEDLKPEREAVRDALERLRMAKCNVMERFGSNPNRPSDFAVNEVSQSDVYVGVIGGRYGTGTTEEEYCMAREKGLPCFIYFKDEGSVLETDETKVQRRKLVSFKKKVNQHLRSRFTSPEHLAVNVVIDFINWYAKEYLPPWADELSRIYLPGCAPFQLPEPSSDFFGREEEIKVLVEALVPRGGTRIAAIHGLGGVGKTQLALQVAERLRAHYPHAQLLVELRDTGPELPNLNTEIVKCILALGGGVPTRSARPHDLQELIKIYQDNLRGKRAVIVVDDAGNEEQALTFTPPPGCALLITSSDELHLRDIDCTSLHLDLLHKRQARKLLLSLVPRLLQGSADQIGPLCGYRPLSLQVAVAWLSHNADIAATKYIQRLRDERKRLKSLRVSGRENYNADEPDMGMRDDVEAPFNLSYKSLKPDIQRTFLRLSVFPASFDDQAEKTICLDNSLKHLKELLKLSLVSYDDKTKRYHLHDLTRVYAARRLSPDERDAVLRAHAKYFLRIGQTIEQLCQESIKNFRKGLEVFNLEWENLSAGQKWSAENFKNSNEVARLCVSYAEALQNALYLRRDQKVQLEWLSAGLEASRRANLRDAEGRLLCSLGVAYALTEPQRAIDDYYQRALKIAREIRDRIGEASALGNLGNAYARLRLVPPAIKAYEECLSVLEELGNRRDAGHTFTNLGNVYASMGKSDDAVKFYRRALKAARKMNDRRGEAMALSNLGKEHARAKKTVLAINHYERALECMDDAIQFRDRIPVLTGLGNAYSAQHKPDKAIKCHQEVLIISSNLGDLSGQSTALGNLGNECAEPGDLDQAIRFHEGALEISRHLNDRESEALDLGNLGHAYYLKGEFEDALKYHKQALTITRDLDNRVQEGITLWNLAQACDKTDDRAATIDYAEEALGIFEQSNHSLSGDVRKFLFGR
jgi:tetratricopeptide (TPR) repeat protein